ncbi:hypothetical protein COT63_01335 [Candidatus Shapirobacteria bacterium CG09_land_8_20_14_0_10_38_17]|uniref:Peptidoglycan glycosyltransferase n=1 Tax=Candidatus Shapirobacteria bacterium CG09_land_8_20_14_0_10_38_17 TaxID=1974884 RepID=A0A2H0WR86_9BACT|nr:MAG: hypothetical protein COT63_01335 [Candidatus Shapirobacteria bacterium CG09_land_8_20_14_0_10_38_17]
MSLSRTRLVFILFLFSFLVIIARLSWWQIVQSKALLAQAKAQRWEEKVVPAKRGEIFFADSYPLASSKPFYNLYAFKPEIKISYQELAEQLAKISSLEKKEIQEMLDADPLWIPIWRHLEEKDREKILSLKISGFQLEEETGREYPEASQAAHLLGFLGKNEKGENQGYFGLEGYYDRQLRGSDGKIIQEKDALGRPIVLGNYRQSTVKNGVDLRLFLDRQLQWIAEKHIAEGTKRYGAQKGLVIISNPQNGGILAMAAYPDFDPSHYSKTESELFLNPAISETFEPGSILKILIMAAALDSDTITPQDICPDCAGPLEIDEYTIRTWNDQYYPNSTMTEIIQHSDNVGMVYVEKQLGLEKTLAYLEQFGIGRRTSIDLQGETTGKLKEKEYWSPIDLATISFGQGIAVTPIQMIQAVNAIANQGKLIQPKVVQEINNNQKIEKIKQETKQIIKPKTAKQITEMMANAVEQGEAKWTKIPNASIAGKTGTAQIPIQGHYDPEKTIASFIGFAPAFQPQLTMLVILYEPTTSPWAAETAAPLWFDIAKDIFLLKSINPK